MPHQLFISYRREDAPDAAQAIYVQLTHYFGLGKVFMDVNSIEASDKYPDRLKSGMNSAKAVVVLMDEKWLMSHDRFGRRRLDLEGDWVRQEVRSALEQKKQIYPVLVGKNTEMPPEEALPADIAALSPYEATTLSREKWTRDITDFARMLEDKGALTASWDAARQVPNPVPDPKKSNLAELTEEELNDALVRLDGWEAWRESLLKEYPHERREIRRNILFCSFRQAIEFIQEAAALFEGEDHHPRWGNEWRPLQ